MCTPLEPKHREYRQETAAKGSETRLDRGRNLGSHANTEYHVGERRTLTSGQDDSLTARQRS